MLSTKILHLAGSCPKNAIISDFTGNILIPKFCAMLCNVNIPLCKLFTESAIMTCSSLKR